MYYGKIQTKLKQIKKVLSDDNFNNCFDLKMYEIANLIDDTKKEELNIFDMAMSEFYSWFVELLSDCSLERDNIGCTSTFYISDNMTSELLTLKNYKGTSCERDYYDLYANFINAKTVKESLIALSCIDYSYGIPDGDDGLNINKYGDMYYSMLCDILDGLNNINKVASWINDFKTNQVRYFEYYLNEINIHTDKDLYIKVVEEMNKRNIERI